MDDPCRPSAHALRRSVTAIALAVAACGTAFAGESTSANRGTVDDPSASAIADLAPRPALRPPEPDRTYRPDDGRQGSDQLQASTDEKSLSRLFEMFRTESVTADGRRETFDLPDSTKERLLEELRHSRRDNSIIPEPSTKPENSSPLGDDLLERSRAIFGADTRDRIFDTKVFPYRTIGYLEGGCSAALIGPRHVLTAGHCVYDIEKNQWKKVGRFWPAQNGDTSPYGDVGVTRLVSITGWTSEHARGADIAMVVLERNLGDQLGWLGYGWEEPMKKYNVNLVGYPGDKPSWTMWHSFCPLERIYDLQLAYRCAQWPGNSGGPVFVFLRAQNTNTIYGVAAYGYIKHLPANADANMDNEATRINRLRYETIKGWIERY